MEGWVKIHRSLLNKSWTGKPEFLAVWIHLLLSATHQEMETIWNGKTIKLKPGQFITGRSKMAANTKVHRSKLERILKWFESEQQIEQQMSTTSRLITILNWNKYQTDEQPFESKVSNKRAASEQRVSTKQECKNIYTNTVLSGRAQKYVDFVNNLFNRRYKLTDKVKTAFRLRISDYSAQELIQVANNVKADDFHKSKGYRYATPEYLLRVETIEKFKSVVVLKKINDSTDPDQVPFSVIQTEQFRDKYYGQQ